MITVSVSVNRTPLFTRSAVRMNMKVKPEKASVYEVDDGTVIYHDYDAGAIPLAIAMLRTINEPGRLQHAAESTPVSLGEVDLLVDDQCCLLKYKGSLVEIPTDKIQLALLKLFEEAASCRILPQTS